MRGIVMAGTHSGCGKTTVTLGIMAALRKKGLTVQPFKAGPDFIDAGLHRIVTGRPSRNLDQWMCGREYVVDCFRRHAADADIAVVEGVMGMYDGDFSTAGLAELLHAPVVLVVDAYGMAESAGAIVSGFAKFGVQSSEFGVKFCGVIFNRVASENHYRRLRDSVSGVPVLGYLPRELDFEIPHRHLGLTIAEENPLAGKKLERLADTVLQFIDVDAIMRNAEVQDKEPHREGARDARDTIPESGLKTLRPSRPGGSSRLRLAVAFDKAFSFYYEDNLDALHAAGAEIVRFSPLVDAAVPAGVDAVYIGGGYPELHADRLSRNASMLASVRAWSEAGKPLYAECGGLMFLSKGIRDFDGRLFGMAGVFPFETRMMKKPCLGYRDIELNVDCILGGRGDRCRGHEFHYSEINAGKVRSSASGVRSEKQTGWAYIICDSRGHERGREGYRYKNTLASYVHVHFGSNNNIAEQFVKFSGQF